MRRLNILKFQNQKQNWVLCASLGTVKVIPFGIRAKVICQNQEASIVPQIKLNGKAVSSVQKDNWEPKRGQTV